MVCKGFGWFVATCWSFWFGLVHIWGTIESGHQSFWTHHGQAFLDYFRVPYATWLCAVWAYRKLWSGESTVPICYRCKVAVFSESCEMLWCTKEAIEVEPMFKSQLAPSDYKKLPQLLGFGQTWSDTDLVSVTWTLVTYHWGLERLLSGWICTDRSPCIACLSSLTNRKTIDTIDRHHKAR